MSCNAKEVESVNRASRAARKLKDDVRRLSGLLIELVLGLEPSQAKPRAA